MTYLINPGGSGGGMAIGDPITDVTDGSVLFAASGDLAQDNTNFFWDNTKKQLALAGGTAGTNPNIIIDRDYAGVDPKIQLINEQNGQYGSAIEGYKVDASGTRQPAGRITFERWTGSANFGQVRIQVGSFGSWGQAATLDANGLFTAAGIEARPTLKASDSSGADTVGLHSNTGATPPGLGVLRHGIWGIDQFNAVFRAGGNDLMTIDWQKRVNIGYPIATTPAPPGKFSVRPDLDSLPTAVFEGHATQSVDVLQLRKSDGTVFVGSGDGLAASEFVINSNGEDIDFRVEGDTDINLFRVDASDDAVLIGEDASSKIAFFGVTAVVQQTELTDELTTITHTAPGTPDFAIQDLVDSSGGAAFGFATKDEGNTVLSVIANLQARVNELETALVQYGLLPDAD